MTTRLLAAIRLAVPAAVLVLVVGAGGVLARGTPLGSVWLTATLGPTAYAILSDPRHPGSRLRSGAIGHGVGLGSGLVALALFGLWHAPSVAETHAESWPQVAAQALAVALTLGVLTASGVSHAPAAATTLLVASGIAAPGKPLVGLVVGLLVVLVLAPLLARLTGRITDRRPPAGSAR